VDSPASQPERADAFAPAPSHAAPPRRRRRLLARLGERTAQFAYIGLWAGIFLLAGIVSTGATFVPFFHRETPIPPAAEPTLPPAPQRILDGGLRLPAKVVGEEIRAAVGDAFAPHFWAGVNLGASVPGREPGALGATRPDFDRWFAEMGELGITVVRVYTIHEPAFYDALRDYNLRHPQRPLYVLHGIWIPEDRFIATRDIWNPQIVRGMKEEIADAVAAVHGDAVIEPVPGHASGRYRSDISPWLLGWSFGIEWDPAASHATNVKHRGMPAYRGRYIRAKRGASPMESWIASNLDELATLEAGRGWSVPLTFTNWDTTDPLHHPDEPLAVEDLVSIDAMHLEATPAWPAGYFASFHAYPYYPDFLRWQRDYQTYHRPRDGKLDPYAGYLHDLRLHHAGIPVMVTEFGQPTSLGCAHLAPLGRDQGCHSEQEAAANVVDMLHDLRDEGLAGGIVFTWIDEWFKFTWNTIDYELPRHNRALWRNVLTNEEHFGIIAAEPGPTDLVVLDGRDDEWATVPSIGSGSGSVGDVAATSDAENVYLRLELDPGSWERKRIVIGLDARPGGNGGLPARPGVDVDAEMAVVIEPGGEARMLHAGWVEPLGRRFGVNETRFIPTDPADVLPESGAWVRLRQLLGYPTFQPSLGRVSPAELRDASLMPWGTTDPASPAFDDRNLVMGRDGVLEIALPWGMLSVADPSTHRLYVVGLDGEVTIRKTDRLGISIAVDGEPLVRTTGYRWDGWDTVQWHERRKAGWPILQRAFHGYLGPFGAGPTPAG
jgi:hypothetical protein